MDVTNGSTTRRARRRTRHNPAPAGMAEELASLSLAISPGAPAADAAFGSPGTSSSPRGGRRGSSGRSMPSKSAPNDDLDEDRRAMHIAAESHTPETHVVAEGDTLGMIAGVYGVPVFTI